MTAAALGKLLDDAAAELEDAERTAAGDGSTVEWSIAGITFAAVSGGSAEFRLGH